MGALNDENIDPSTSTSAVSAVALNNTAAFGVCVYPTSVSLQGLDHTLVHADRDRVHILSSIASSTTALSSSPSSHDHTSGSSPEP